MLFKKEKGEIKVTPKIFNALKSQIWSERLKVICGRRVTDEMIEGTGWVRYDYDIEKSSIKRKYAFSKRIFNKRNNLLKKFLYEDSLMLPSSGQQHVILHRLEFWKYPRPRNIHKPFDQKMDSYPMAGFPDTAWCFPKGRIKELCIEKGYVEEIDMGERFEGSYSGNIKNLYLTKEGLKLKRIKKIMEV